VDADHRTRPDPAAIRGIARRIDDLVDECHRLNLISVAVALNTVIVAGCEGWLTDLALECERQINRHDVGRN
jgi:hypothetical protein